MSFKLLIECLHPGLVALAKDRGIVAEFGPHIGKTGWQDHNLVQFAVANDYILVTNNWRDFLKLYMQHDVHGGLIVLVPRADRARMDRLFLLALAKDSELGDDLVHKVIEVLEDETVHVRSWHRDEHDVGHIKSPRFP